MVRSMAPIVSSAKNLTLRFLAIPLVHLVTHPLARIRRWYYHHIATPAKLPGTVISIGNIASGGTGKSPVCLAIAAELQRLGGQPAILTRGYRSGLRPQQAILLCADQRQALRAITPQELAAATPDEATMQALALPGTPIIVGANRLAAAKAYLATGAPPPSHWLLDDGFQHLKIHRDLDLVLVDAQDPWGTQDSNLGSLVRREAKSALKQADLVLLTRYQPNPQPSPCESWLAALGIPWSPVPFCTDLPQGIHAPHKQVTQHGTYGLATNIAAPHRLQQFLSQQGITISADATLLGADHRKFAPQQLRDLCRQVDGIITTAKDYARQPAVFDSLPKEVFIPHLAAHIGSRVIAMIDKS